MLQSLHIANYALIDNIDIRFADGLNIITGETGAGKSIMLGALSLILGGRADTKVVTNHDAKSVIEAIFDVTGNESLRAHCIENDIEWDDTQCILRREISPAGRSRAFINDSPVPLATLRGVALRLVDIHSQHQNQLLASPEFQMDVIDTLADNGALLAEHSRRFAAFRNAIRRLKALKAKVARERDDEEFTRFQLEQIDTLAPVAGEQTRLEQRRDILADMTRFKGSLIAAIDSLADGHASAIDRIAATADACADIDTVLPPDADIPARLESLSIEAADIAATLRQVSDRLDADPGELTDIEDRLAAIYELQHKHHVDTVEALIDIRDNLAARLASLDDSTDAIEAAGNEARRALALARETADELTAARRAEAGRFAERLIALAAPMAMKNLRVEIAVDKADISATGADTISFMVAFNKNQQLMPVGQTASGGELSRLMLCIKTIIASRMQLPSIIFDEIDTGVSGDVAARMGALMKQISASLQVIAITHLPQVAALGDTHFKVFKEDDDNTTHTRLRRLDDDARVAELAAMLSADAVTPAALANARALLGLKN